MGWSPIWLSVTINLLGFSHWVERQIDVVGGLPIAGSSANITLGGVLGFFAILLIGYSVSSAIRFFSAKKYSSLSPVARLAELIASTMYYFCCCWSSSSRSMQEESN